MRAERDHLAVVDDADAVAELLRLGHVVRGVEDRHPLVAEREDAVEDRPPALRVDPHRRLVEVQHLGLVQQRDADVDAPLHAAAELVDAVLLAVDEGDELQHLVDPLLERVAREPVHAAPEHEVLARAHVRVQGDVLRDDADGLLDRLGVAHDGVPGDDGVAAGGLEQAAQHGDGGALAGAVGAEQAEDLALARCRSSRRRRRARPWAGRTACAAPGPRRCSPAAPPVRLDAEPRYTPQSARSRTSVASAAERR